MNEHKHTCLHCKKFYICKQACSRADGDLKSSICDACFESAAMTVSA